MTELGTAGGTGVPGGLAVSVILPTYNRCDVVETLCGTSWRRTTRPS